jgi:hypothetical protein
MRRGRIVAVVRLAMMVMVMTVVIVVMIVAVGMGVSHAKMLYYNITQVHLTGPLQGLPIAMDNAAARNGNGSETAARNQTNLAGMNGISHKISRWKANSAQEIT